MNTKNSRTDFAFVLLSYTNLAGIKNVLRLLNEYYPNNPIVIENNNPGLIFEKEVSLKAIKSPQVVVNNNINLGFAKGCNLGALIAKDNFNPKYFIFLNDDVSFKQDWVNPCLEQLKKQKWIATTPVLRNPKGEIENVGYIVLPHGKIELIKDLNSKKTLDGITGAALIFDAQIFLKLGGFDERFFAYLEDVDLCLRAAKRGYKFGVCKDASVYHVGQASWSKRRIKKAWLNFKNWILLIAKNWDRQTLLKNLPAILVERGRNFWGIMKTIFATAPRSNHEQ